MRNLFRVVALGIAALGLVVEPSFDVGILYKSDVKYDSVAPFGLVSVTAVF